MHSGRFEAALTSAAADEARELREGADYEAADVREAEAQRIIALGERFVAEVEVLLSES